MKWKTIESAPKGHVILVAWFGKDRCVIQSDIWADHKEGWWRWKKGTEFNQPTHWMPLPKPPEQSS